MEDKRSDINFWLRPWEHSSRVISNHFNTSTAHMWNFNNKPTATQATDELAQTTSSIFKRQITMYRSACQIRIILGTVLQFISQAAPRFDNKQ